MSGEPNPHQRTLRRTGSDESVHDIAELPSDRRMAALVTRLERIRRAQMNQMDLGTADLRILWLFADGHCRTLKQIAADLSLEQSTVNRQINAAIALGLLERTREPGSAAQLISPTEQGIKAFEDDVDKARAGMRVGLEVLGEGAEAFLGQFTAFLAAYEGAVYGSGDSDRSS